MNPRFWIFLAGVLGGLAVIAGAAGAHATGAAPIAARIFDTAQVYHAFHSAALLGVGVLLLATSERRAAWAGTVLQFAALAFAAGILLFSGGIYVQLSQGFSSSGGIVPFGGVFFIIGWGLLAIGALGLRR